MWRRTECPWSRAVEDAARGFTRVNVPRCEIRHDPDLDPFEVAMFGRACGAAVETVERLLGVRLRRWWFRTGRVGVLLLASAEDVGRLYGGPCGGFSHYAGWYVAVNIQSAWAEDLRHEFTHLAAGRWNPAPPTVWREGLAVWAQRNVGGQPVEHLVRNHAPGPRTALDLLLGAMPDDIVPRWSYYVVAGGFTAFLIRRFGWAAYLDLYQDRVATRENLPTRFAHRVGVSVDAAVKMWYGELPRDPAPTVLQKRLLAAKPMTESDWHAKDAPRAMFEFVRGRASTRQFRHFGAACCRAVWDDLPDDRLKAAVECVEAYASWKVTKPVLAASQSRAKQAVQELGLRARSMALAQENAQRRPTDRDWEPYYDVARRAAAADAVPRVARPTEKLPALAESVLQAFDLVVQAQTFGRTVRGTYQLVFSSHAAVIRCVFGNPFYLIEFDPTWRTEAVVGLARGAYEDRAFDRLPVLADALEDAGCNDAQVLNHLRGGGVHVRGCWCVDAVLGLT